MPLGFLGLNRFRLAIDNLLRQQTGEDERIRNVRDVQPLTRDALYAYAKQLASDHDARVSGRGSRLLFRRFSSNCLQLDEAYRILSEAAQNKEFLTPGAEWLLDNYHVIQRQIQDIQRHFPVGYDRTLPKLVSGPYARYPRVYHIALELLRNSASVVGVEILSAFVSGYQERQVLTIGELWAVPIMLRFALIENLSLLARRMVTMRAERKEAASLVDEILGEESQSSTQVLLELAAKLSARPDFITTGAPYLLRRLRERGRRASLTVQWFEERLREEGLEPEEVLRTEQHILAADQITIGNSFTSLKAINYIDWKDWVESVSVVHRVLSRDPMRVYNRSDFRTRDLHRRRIELLAKRTRRSEVDVAEQAVVIAEEFAAHIPEQPLEGLEQRRAIVGYYLLDAGKWEFEDRLGYGSRPLVALLRFLRRHALPLYLGAIGAISLLCMGQVFSFILSSGGSFITAMFTTLLFSIPASEIATTIVQWFVTWIVPPYQLPKLEFKDGIPEEHKTVVVVQTIFADTEAVERGVNALEVRYLANIEPNVVYGLLADLPDADTEITPLDREIMTAAEQAIARLRERYDTENFFVLFRRRLWNEAQKKFMGWERKRGKIEEFNRLILGKGETTFLLSNSILRLLRGVRYCITLDSDSQLPRGVVRELVGTIAHPLNRPVLSEDRSRVIAGYSVIQPRMGVSLLSANSSTFAGIFSGHAGLDPYTQTVSEVYQDLFQEGSFIGKGIYDIEAFHHALANRVPENALLSHDLFEGNHARVALASDIELFDDFPSRYHVHTRRLHRWVRGDWQLLPWLCRRVPNAEWKKTPGVMSPLGRYKIFDNLRRSLVAPSIFFLFFLGLTVLPGPFSYWAAWTVFVIAIPIYLNIAQAFLIPARGLSITSYVRGVGRDLVLMSKRAFLTFSFIPHQAYLMIHAIIVTLYRMFISRRNLLEWETAAASERKLGTTLQSFVREMAPALILTGCTLLIMFLRTRENFLLASPFLLLWASSPWIAWRLSVPLKQQEEIEISPEDREYLMTIAWKTWRYFREHMNAEHNFLVPDNIQLVPQRVVAPRTSPTNISLSILTVISAYDFGFLNLPAITERVRDIFSSLKRLEKFRGHFLNWYSTRTLDPLQPRYVSFVDSGNLVGFLLAAKTAFERFQTSPLVHERHLTHIRRLLDEAGRLLSKLDANTRNRAEGILVSLTAQLRTPPENTRELVALLHTVQRVEDRIPEFVAQIQGKAELVDNLLVLDEEVGEITRILSLFDWYPLYEELRAELEGTDVPTEIAQHVAEVERFLQTPCPSLTHLTHLDSTIRRLVEIILHSHSSLAKHDRGEHTFPQRAHDLLSAWERTNEYAHRLLNTLKELLEDVEEIIRDVDFTFLYDNDRDLFAIGYDISNVRRDTSYYDLLASEARLGSLVAIALGQVPQRHWFSLGRPLTDAAGTKVLVSWGGTMFEYLMPLLVTKSYPGTLLAESCRGCVKAQIDYGRKLNVPWGISESGYSGVDFEKTYQYHAFGVPGLGLKRGLEEDLVISPYSTLLALPVLFHEALENLRLLEQEGLVGEYGFFEAADYTPERLSVNERKHLVQSFFAHHQGMGLVALDNVLHNGIFQERFHSDPRIRATELLLHERFPDRIPVIVPHTAHLFPLEREEAGTGHFTLQSFSTPHTEVPRTHLLSNGHLAIMVDNAGSGFSIFEREIALTRWREDQVTNNLGSYIFIRDLDSWNYWSVGFQPSCTEPESYEVFFGPDKIEFKRTDSEIFIHAEITVSPEDNVEIRRVALTNLSSRLRNIELTSYGEVVLQSARADLAHPAFSKMSVESEFLSDFDALLFSRRPRSVHDERLYLLHMVTQRLVWDRVYYESSRFRFIGRGNTIRRPAALDPHSQLSGTTGLVLDPIFSLRTRIEIEPGQTETVTFVTAVSKARDEALGLAARYRELHHISRAFEMAWSQSGVELRSEHGAAHQWHIFQRLGNALLHNIDKLRAREDVIMRNRLGQSGLWRFGIGGDYPICLVRITEPDQTKLVHELLHAHHFLRMRGLIFELVILNEYPGGYLQNLQEELDYLMKSSLSGALVEKKGGLFLRTTLQLSDEEKDLLQSVARVVLSGLRGSLEQQLKFDDRPGKPVLNAGRSALPRTQKGKTLALEDAELFNSYGGFLRDKNGYGIQVISRLPPLPWSNIVANRSFGFLATETGGGYTWADNCRENRITPWSNDPVSDPAGECLFLRDIDTGIYWTPTPRPVQCGGRYLVEHHFGFSRYLTELEGIESELTLTIAREDRTKWYALTLKNTGDEPRTLELFFYVDWVLGVTREETMRHIVTSFNEVSQTLVAVNHYNADFGGRIAFIGSSHPIESFTASRTEFIGRNRALSTPRVLELALRAHTHSGVLPHAPLSASGKAVTLSRKTGAGFDPCGVLKIVISLRPNRREDVLFFLGQATTRDEMFAMARRASSLEFYAEASRGFHQHVEEITSSVEVRTPEPTFDRLMNGWLIYQTYTARLLARTGFYQSGGAWGFRDQLQDVLALLYTHPEYTRSQILLHASRQFPEGDVQHWWHPPSGKGVRTKISDDFLFLPFAVERYLDVTRDLSLLDERVPFIDGPKLGENEHEAYIVPHPAGKDAFIYDHCVLAIEHALHFGVHGLPLIGCGDWNDGMNEVGRQGLGESVWLGWFLVHILRRFAPIVAARGDQGRAERFLQIAAQLEDSIDREAWDGEWYRRAYFDDGTPLGSRTNDECQIDSIAQSWSVIAGTKNQERSLLALESAYRRLVDPEHRIVKLLTPPFDKGSLNPGYIKGYLPGIRENGGQYTHAAAWMVIAYALLGDGKTAVELFQMINPVNHTRTAEEVEIYQGEPYVVCGDVYAVPPHEGRAGWSWYTGSASWMFQAGIEYILGLVVRGDSFTVNPCVPSSWREFGFSYRRGGTTYRVQVKNPDGVQRGVKEITVNGRRTEGNRVLLHNHPPYSTVVVDVVMG